MELLHITNESFDSDVLQSELPVLVDFYADWCGPCKMLGPVIEEIAGEYQGKLKVVKLNVDNADQIAARYGVMSIPTVILFKKGEIVHQMVGFKAKDAILREFGL